MGFIQALYDLGVMGTESVTCGAGDNNIGSYLQMPLPVISDAKKSGREIRIWLAVDDKEAATLNVQGVARFDLVEYPCVDKEKYLYREPVSPAASWRFTPVYKLGAPKGDVQKELMGKGGEASRRELAEWLKGERTSFTSPQVQKEIKENRFFKLKNAVLDAFEKDHVLAAGAVNKIMKHFIDNIDQLVSLWSDSKRSYILVFGIDDGGRFLYPGEISAFRRYFAQKLTEFVTGGSAGNNKTKFCAVCGVAANEAITIDKLFTFATFDKPSFLPGAKNAHGAKEKVYPVCQSCFTYISEAREQIKENFRDAQTIPGLNIDIIPELLFKTASLKRVAAQTEEFLRKGIKREETRFNKLAEQGDGLVYHFVFWEQNQKQERVHLIIEDVPPSRLKKVLNIWQDTVRVHWTNDEEEATSASIDSLFRLLYRVLMSLAGKQQEEKKVMRDKWVQMTGRLLGGNQVDVYWLKTLIVSRLPGLFADHDWVNKNGRREVKTMAALVDFFARANARWNE